jgi:ABC-type multidrug transport system ATPase subunit
MAVLEVRELTKRYAGRTVLDRVSFTSTPGRVTVIRGRNGSGKTTLLRCLAGSVRPDGGEVLLNGARLDLGSPRTASSVYAILDDFSWFPELTVGDHLLMLDPENEPEVTLARFGASALVDRTAATLSSGQMRRSALATALVRPWQVLLLDEPEQRLDDDGVGRLAIEVRAFAQGGRCVVISTHSDALQSRLDADELRLA